MSDRLMVYAILVLFTVVAFWIGPLALIWSLNTLFGLGIAYSFWTWLSAAVLLLLLPRSLTVKGK